MTVAIALWDNRIAPLFVTAPEILLIPEVGVRIRICFGPDDLPQTRIKTLMNREVDTLLCGALPCRIEREIAGCGIAVYPFLCGLFDDIWSIYESEPANLFRFRMPGCRRDGIFHSNLKE